MGDGSCGKQDKTTKMPDLRWTSPLCKQIRYAVLLGDAYCFEMGWWTTRKVEKRARNCACCLPISGPGANNGKTDNVSPSPAWYVQSMVKILWGNSQGTLLTKQLSNWLNFYLSLIASFLTPTQPLPCSASCYVQSLFSTVFLRYSAGGAKMDTLKEDDG